MFWFYHGALRRFSRRVSGVTAGHCLVTILMPKLELEFSNQSFFLYMTGIFLVWYDLLALIAWLLIVSWVMAGQ